MTMRNAAGICGMVALAALAAGGTCMGGTSLLDGPPAGTALADAGRGAGVDAVDGDGNWLALGDALAQQADKAAAGAGPAASQPGGGAEAKPAYVPYDKRRGPAYPGEFWTSFGRDGKEFAPMMLDDAVAVATNPFSLVCLGLAGAAGIAMNGGNGDEQVAKHFSNENHHTLNSFWDSVGDAGGNPGTHFALAGAMYFASYAIDDTKTYEVSKTMLSALAINGITTLTLKAAVRTHSPNGDDLAWPSGHASSSFTVATVLAESYGPLVGVPAYAFAAYVGFERLDARNHNFSDVISGALIGIAIGHAVSQKHMPKLLGMDVVPYVDDRGAAGLALVKNW
jgi:hypothetical protein